MTTKARKLPRVLAIIVGIAALPVAIAAFDDYPARSIASLLGEFAPQASNKYLRNPSDVYLEFGAAAAKSRVVCSGQIRPIPGEKLNFLSGYFRARQQPDYIGFFKDETLCREGKTVYWLPVQASVMAYLKKDAESPVTIDLYVVYVGSFRSADKQLVPVITVGGYSPVVEDK